MRSAELARAGVPTSELAGLSWKYQLGAICFMRRAGEPWSSRSRALERFEKRQVRFGTRKPLGTAPSSDLVVPARSAHFAQKGLHHGGLADATFTDDAQQTAAALLQRRVQTLLQLSDG